MGKQIWKLYLVGMLFHSFAFWQIVVEKYHAKLKWILQALLGIQRWNLMTLDLLIFWECSSVNLHANRGVGCGIDIQGKGSCPSTSQNISLGRITPSS
jgi:hypothetical protein